MNRPLLLLFVRTPLLGHVKTRLAAGLGHEGALAVYQKLLAHTYSITQPLENLSKWVCYADKVPQEADLWSEAGFEKLAQPESIDLGNRMGSMMEKAFKQGYSPVVIIGSDCPGLSTQILEEALMRLGDNDVVIGPAEDGGYYLLGLKVLVPELFRNIPWSTSEVLHATIAEVKKQELSMALLPTLTDIDVLEDLVNWPAFKP